MHFHQLTVLIASTAWALPILAAPLVDIASLDYEADTSPSALQARDPLPIPGEEGNGHPGYDDRGRPGQPGPSNQDYCRDPQHYQSSACDNVRDFCGRPENRDRDYCHSIYSSLSPNGNNNPNSPQNRCRDGRDDKGRCRCKRGEESEDGKGKCRRCDKWDSKGRCNHYA